MKFYFSLLILVILFSSCTSVPDIGIYNQSNVEESDLVSIEFAKNLYLNSIDGERFKSGLRDAWLTGFKFKIPSGEHLFNIEWVQGMFNHWNNIEMTTTFEPGKTYKVQENVKELVLTISIIEVESKSVIQSATRTFSGIKYF